MVKQRKGEKTMLYYQRDPRWSGEIMTEATPDTDPLRRSWKDTLGQYGCLVTCMSNIFEILMNKKFQPKDTNDILKQNKVYYYQNTPTGDEGLASTIVWDSARTAFPYIDFKLFVSECKNEENVYYIGELKNRFHFVNIIARKKAYFDKDIYIVYDVWDGRIKIMVADDFDYFHALKLKVA